MQATDADLIMRFLAGDPRAFTTIDNWLIAAAWPYRRRLGSHWEDVLQDLRLEVIRLFRQRHFRGDASLRTYLCRVASHACLNRIQTQERWCWTHLPEDAPPASLCRTDTDERLACRDVVREVLEHMSPECRRLCSLLQAGYSYHEMSEYLGLEETTLRVQVLRCRRRAQRLRELLLTGGIV